MTTLFKDTFTDANNVLIPNHIPDVGTARWVKVSGTNAGITSNQLQMLSGGSGDSLVLVNIGQTNVKFTFKWAGVHAWNGAVLKSNNDGSSSFWFGTDGLYDTTGTKIGNMTTPAANDVFVITFNTDSTITVTKNGSQIISTSSTQGSANTYWGFSMGLSGYGFDDVQIDDFNTGAVGTDGSKAFDLKQVLYRDSLTAYDSKQALYRDSFFAADTKQSFYQDGSIDTDTRQMVYNNSFVNVDSKQTIYNDSAFNFDTKQAIYSDSAINLDTKQQLFNDSFISFDTLQQLINDGLIGSISFDLKQVLFADNQINYDSRQTFYKDGSFVSDLLQQIYNQAQISVDTKQILFSDNQIQVDTMQSIYADSLTKFDTLLVIYDVDKRIIGTIRLQGNRVLDVHLQGERALNIKLQGKRDLNINLKGLIQ